MGSSLNIIASMPAITVRQMVAATERIRFVKIGIRILLSFSILRTPVTPENRFKVHFAFPVCNTADLRLIGIQKPRISN
jgi:hypothetical protein